MESTLIYSTTCKTMARWPMMYSNSSCKSGDVMTSWTCLLGKKCSRFGSQATVHADLPRCVVKFHGFSKNSLVTAELPLSSLTAQLLADSVRASNMRSWSPKQRKNWKAGSTSSRTYFWGQCNEFIHSFQHILQAAKEPPATSCWFLHNRINVQQICKCDNPSLPFPCLMADFLRLRRGYGFF